MTAAEVFGCHPNFILDLFGNPQKGLPIFPKNEILGNMGKISYGFRTSLFLQGTTIWHEFLLEMEKGGSLPDLQKRYKM